DLAIKNAVYETLNKKPFDRQSDYEDTIIDVLRGSWNFKDLMTNVINQIDSIAKVKTPGDKGIKEVLSLSKEDIMQKYSLPEELAQIVLDFITEKANSKDADSVADLVKNYIDLCSNLDDIINPKLDNSVIMDPHVLYGYSSPDGEYDISNNWEFFSYLVQRMLGPAQEAEDILKKTSSQSLIDWFNNSEICNFIDNSIYAGSSELHGMPTNFGVFMLRIFTTTLAFPSMNDENKLQAENIPDLFWCPGYNKMVKNVFDKNGNGAIDELFEIMKDLFKDCRETAEYIVNNRAEYELRDALAQYSAKYNPADYFDTGLLDHANIPYTTEVVLHNDNRYDIIRFTFDGLDYEIVTYRKSEEEYRTVNDVSNKEIDQFIEDKYTNNAYVGDLLANSLYNLISCDTPYRLSQAFCDEDKLQDLFNAVRGNIDVSETLYSIVKCEHATADGMFDCIALVLKNLYKVNKNSSDEDILNALQNLCKDIGVYDEMDYRANNFEHVVSKTDWRGRPNFNECGDDISKLDSGYYYYDKATGTKFPNYTRFVEYMDERNGKIFGNFMKLLYKVPECKNTVKEVYLEETERRAHVIIRTSPAGTVTEPASVNFEPEDEEIKLLKAKAEKLYNHNFSTEGTIDEETIIAFCDDLMKTKYAYLVTQVCGRNYAEYIRNLYQTNWFYAPPSLLDAFALVMSIDDNFLKVLEDEEIASVTDPKNKNGYQNIITY
ncbi:hypothetical protein IJ750_05600, partial [bacterium]|nr:hypothetical protein [bacterium]